MNSVASLVVGSHFSGEPAQYAATRCSQCWYPEHGQQIFSGPCFLSLTATERQIPLSTAQTNPPKIQVNTEVGRDPMSHASLRQPVSNVSLRYSQGHDSDLYLSDSPCNSSRRPASSIRSGSEYMGPSEEEQKTTTERNTMLNRSLCRTQSANGRRKAIRKRLNIAYRREPLIPTTEFYCLNNDRDSFGANESLSESSKETFRSLVDPTHVLRVGYSLGWGISRITQPVLHSLPDSAVIWAIRIESEPISAFFKQLVDPDISDGSIIEMEKPFRTLIRNFAAISKHLDGLERMYRSVKVRCPLTRIANKHSTLEELDHFRLLAGFINCHLKRSLLLYCQVQRETIRQIAFPDLWMLYDFDTAIYHSEPELGSLRSQSKTIGDVYGEHGTGSSYKQAYRVMATVGGIPLHTGLQRTIGGQDPAQHESKSLESVKGTYSALRVVYYRIDYDSNKWAPIHEVFELDPFEGTVDIASLGLFPIHKADQVSNKVRERGEKFVRMTEISHWTHDGLTLGSSGNRQHVGNLLSQKKSLPSYIYFQVISPVIVDLSLAAQGGYLKLPRLGHKSNEVTASWITPEED
ncbi:P-loop containing nucleoside triphosphate hydrolase [Ilyonectria robusta]